MALADDVVTFVHDHLDVELTPWQESWLRRLYGDPQSTTE